MSKINKWQLVTFLLFALVIPFAYLTVRFGLFTKVEKLQVGIWGVIAIGILIGVIAILINYYVQDLKKWNLFKQILQGICKLILPLVISLIVVILIKENIDKLKEVLIIMIGSESVAVVVNPFPKWCYENNLQTFTEMVDNIFTRKKR